MKIKAYHRNYANIPKEIWFMNNSVWDGEKFIEKKSKDDKRFYKLIMI